MLATALESAMGTVGAKPPPALLSDLSRLRAVLDDQIPAKRLDHNLLIATWNLRAFGELTEKWSSGPKDTPKRDLHAVALITEIVSRFDVIAIQETRGNIASLRRMVNWLGPDWGLILTDPTRGAAGNDERLAFVFDLRRVKPSGLACELVVPPDRKIPQVALERQFARTPYAVSFRSAGQTFILVTLHVLFGKKATDRLTELRRIADWMADWAKDTSDDFHQNLIALGDFNIDREGDPNYEAFTSRGLSPPEELRGLPRTLFDKPAKSSFYDQIAWFHEEGEAKLTLDYSGRAGNFDFADLVLPNLDREAKSWRISDHYPLWAEFLVPLRLY
jgi:endonuclease/exonuclease/phosphatase family metal-dependent hydrolase